MTMPTKKVLACISSSLVSNEPSPHSHPIPGRIKNEFDGDGGDHLNRFSPTEGGFVFPLLHRVYNRSGGMPIESRLSIDDPQGSNRTVFSNGGFQHQRPFDSD